MCFKITEIRLGCEPKKFLNETIQKIWAYNERYCLTSKQQFRLQCWGHTQGVMVIVDVDRHGDLCSNPERNCLHFM